MVNVATAEEAAAIAAAIERFVAESGAALEGVAKRVDPWQRAALIEGVSAKDTVQDLEGGARWLS
jgi:hypothetical protein